MSSSENTSKCPVDHGSRAKWLSTEALSGETASAPRPLPRPPQSPSNRPPLQKAREVSSIPRTDDSHAARNSEHTSASVSPASKNWIYPSEEMFFNAMRRKAYDPRAEDMKTIVPIHNAVNERAWQKIKEWEAGRGSEKCGGPKLASFSGDVKRMTPKARLMVLFGYSPPFDRHDWVVDRCGKKIKYVIDFYAGKPDPSDARKLSFYLDVRPKLTVEGAVMRVERWVRSWF